MSCGTLAGFLNRVVSAQSDGPDGHSGCYLGQHDEVTRIGGEYNSRRFCDSDHEGIDRGTPPGRVPEPCAAPSQGLWDLGDDIARFE